jgi:peptidoglycan/LPS O-acetylase OafA/YrhL
MPGDARVSQAGEVRSARIESLRAVAAVSVLVGHTFGVAEGFGTTGFAHRLGLAGNYGVFLFFALSGYLLFWPFARRDYGAGGRIRLRRYALNRALRILPLYYVVLAVFLVLNEGGGSFTQWLRFGTFTESFFSDSVLTVDGPMWSLSVELQFYALLPLVAWVVVRLSRGSIGWAAALIAVAGFASLIVWWLKVHRVGAGVDPRWIYSLPAMFLAFVPGMLLALLRVRIESRPARPSWLRPDVLLLSSVPFWLLAAYRVDWVEPLCTVASLLVVAAVVLPEREGALARALDWRPLALLGIASYGLYLWHLPVVESMGRRTDASFLPLLAIVLPLCVAIAAAGYLVVERPFLQMRRRWGPTVNRTSPWSPKRGCRLPSPPP